MKTLQQISEGILGPDLDTEIETSSYENEILKLLEQWHSKAHSGYRAKKGTDAIGQSIDVGDWVMCWGGLGVEFGKIIKTHWDVRNGSNLTVIKNNKPMDYYLNKMTGELAANARNDYTLKLDAKSVYTIVKELCKA